MPSIVIAILALLAQAPQELATIQALWAAVRGGASATDQATLDALINAMSGKLDTDFAALAAALAARGSPEAPA